MAIEFKNVKHQLENQPLTRKEIDIIVMIEKHIDKMILEKFDGDYVSIPTGIVDFKFNPDNPRQATWEVFKDIKSTRKGIMKIELKRRFELAGWKWDFQEGEDDGPNRPAIDFWHLIGKK